MSTALVCSGLRKVYPDTVAVDGVDLTIEAGTCLGLLGPNGAGKTTAVEMIEGLTVPTAGTIDVFGLRWGSGRASDQAIRASIGVQLQETHFSRKMRVEEVIVLFRSLFKRGRDPDELLALVQLEPKRRAFFDKLSGGQKQRLALACALVGAPKLLCLDEPTTGLDPQARLAIWQIVDTFKREGGTVLLTTHYMDEAAKLADDVAVMDKGKIIARGTPDGLIASLGAQQVVDLTTEPPLPLSDFDDLPSVQSVRARPPGVRLAVDSIAGAMGPLLERVEARGARLDELSTHRATLEDVFVHLTGRGLRDG